MRRVTFSRNYTLSLSRTCRCYCKYCAFATHRAHLYTPDEVEERLEQAVRRNAKELLVLAVCAVAFNPRARHEWAPFAIGLTLGLDAMIFGPLTGSAVNPARWFGPALIGNFFGGTWPYLVGPAVGALAAALLYRFVIAGPQFALGPEPPTAGAEVVENVAADVETATRPRD